MKMMKNIKYKLSVIYIICLVCSSLILANNPLSAKTQQPDSINLEEVLVVARMRPTIVPNQSLHGELLKGLSSFSVADAIRYFSGVQIKDYGGIGGLKTINIRGMGSEHVGVFYNGLQIGNAQNGQVDLGKFSMENVEQISLYNGQKSDLLQPAKDYASSSSIYITSKEPFFSKGKKTNLSTTIKTGSFGLISPSMSFDKELNKNLILNINTEFVHADGKYKYTYKRADWDGNILYDTTAVRENGDVSAFRIESGLFGKIKDGNYKINGYFYDSERGIPGAIVNNKWLNSQRQWDRNAFIQGNIRKRFGDKYSLLINAKYSYDYLRYLNPDTTLKYLDNSFYQKEAYISAAHKYSILKSWNISLSTDFQYNVLDSNLDGFVSPERFTLLNSLASGLTIKDVSLQGNILHTLIVDKIRIGNAEKEYAEKLKRETQSIFTPALFLSYEPYYIKGLTMRSFYKYIFRSPTFNDLYYTEIGNINLKPEYTRQYNLGLTYSNSTDIKFINNYEFQADCYYNKVTNKIVAVPKGSGQFRWQMMNIGEVDIKGVDVSSSVNFILFPKAYLNIKASYSYQRVRDLTVRENEILTQSTYGGQIAYMPWHNGSFLASVRYRGWGMNYSFIYVGERYSTSDNSEDYYIDPWYTSDLSFLKEFGINKHKLKISFEVNNLLNQQYEVILNYPMPGRNYKLSLTYTL